jgi:hypothetical protein
MGGNDHLGSSFVKAVRVPKGEVRSMWIVTDIGSDQSPGIYRAEVAVAAEGTRNYTVDLTLHVRDEVAVNRGYNIPQNQSRLNWLDSGMGIDDEVVAPYIPVKVNGRTVSVLGRKLTFNTQGLPEKITSSFTGSNHSVNGPEKNILSGAIRMAVMSKGQELKFSAGRARIIHQAGGSATWESALNSPDIGISVKAKMECDGYVNYETKIRAKSDILLDDVQLVIPFEKSTAKYLMGMGKQGGYTPEKLEWRWNQEFANNMIWLGDVNAGLQVKLKHLVPDWKLGSFEQVGPYRDWSNGRHCEIISLQKKKNRPLLLGTSRHVTQGAVDLMKLHWSEPDRVWSGTSQVVINDPYELRIYTGDKTNGESSWEVMETTVPETVKQAGVSVEVIHEKDLTRIVISSPVTCSVDWSIRFRKLL